MGSTFARLLGVILWCAWGLGWAEAEMPAGLREALEQARHGIETEAGGYRAHNPRNAQQIAFREGGIEVVPAGPDPGWSWGLQLIGYGTPQDLQALPSAQGQVSGTRVEYRRGSLTEWYDNRVLGLEQGFTLHEPPPGTDGDLLLALRLRGGLSPQWDQTGQALSFYTASGDYALSYRDLKAVDVRGHPLPAHLALRDQTLEIHLDVRDAHWPISVDPLVVNEQKVTAPATDAPVVDISFGRSVALDGDTAVVGAPADTCSAGLSICGAVYVFTRLEGAWILEQKLMASDAAGDSAFGIAVALSGDTLLVGAMQADCVAGADCGAVYFFTREGNRWTEQQKLTASDAAENHGFGLSIALSGSTALVGGGGAAYVFYRSGPDWIEQQKLTASDTPGDFFGWSVALSGDTALVGAMYHACAGGGYQCGAVYVYTRSGGTWTEQQRLTARDAQENAAFGQSVAVSGDTAFVGAPFTGCDEETEGAPCGAAYVFTRSAGVWTQQQKLIATDQALGYSVAIAGDMALVGVVGRKCAQGSTCTVAYRFTRAEGGWIRQQAMNLDVGGEDWLFGWSVALSGNAALVGPEWLDCSGGDACGAAYVFSIDSSAVSQPQAKLVPTPSDLREGDKLGGSVALSGDTALVGIPFADCPAGVLGEQCGAAYVFRREGATWTEEAKLTASDAVQGSHFGISVAVAGETALVGQYCLWARSYCDAAAYVFTRSDGVWTQQQKLIPQDAGRDDWFGAAVALSTDTALVGAPLNGGGARYAGGAAYVFSNSDGLWAQQQKLTASDAADNSGFGFSIALAGETALVGASSSPCTGGKYCGAAYVFTRSGAVWTEQQKLTGAGGHFGSSVALSGDTALVGALGADCPAGFSGFYCGAAYVFTRSGSSWTEQQRLIASDPATNQVFGGAVALAGETALVGAQDHACAAGGDQCGAAYVYTRSGGIWTEQQRLTASDAAAGDLFGSAVALSGHTALVGAPYSPCPGGGFYCGAAYFYTFPCGFGYALPPEQWRLIGSPCSPQLPGTVESTYGADLPGPYGSDWRLYAWDADAGDYRPLGKDAPVEPGLGTWIKGLDGGTLAVEGTATPVLGMAGCPGSNGCYVIPLSASADGMAVAKNLVAHPLAFPVDWADVRVRVDGGTLYTPSAAQAAGLLSNVYYRWNGNAYEAYDDVTPGMEGALQAFEGFWVKLLPGSHGHTLELLIPAKPSIKTSQLGTALPWVLAWLDWLAPAAQAEELPTQGFAERDARREAYRQNIQAGREWYLRLTVTDPVGGLRDRNNVLGQLLDAQAGYDSHDLPELPPFGETSLTLVFPHPDWGAAAGDYASDFRPADPEGQRGERWGFEVRSDDPRRSLVLSWEGPAGVLEGSLLVDTLTGTQIPATEGSYPFDLTGSTRTFRWEYRPPNDTSMRYH